MVKQCISCQKDIEEIYSICKSCAEEFLSDNIFGMSAEPLITSSPIDRYREDSEPTLAIGERPTGELQYEEGKDVLEELRSIQVEDMDEEDYASTERRMNTILAESGVSKEIDFEKYLFSKAEARAFSELFYTLEDLEHHFSERKGNSSLYLRIGNLFYHSYRKVDTGLFEPSFRERIKNDYVEQAEGYYELSYNTDNSEILSLRNRGFLLLDSGELRRAEEYLKKFLSLDPKNVKAQLGLVDVLLNKGNTEEAEENLEKVIDTDVYSYKRWYLEGEIAREKDKWGRAIQFYDKAIENDEGFLPALLSKADLLMEREWYEDASEVYHKILRTEKENISALEGKGTILTHQEEHERAIGWFEEALAVDPHEKDIWVKTAENLQELERYEEAKKNYENALKIDSDLERAIEGKEECETKIE